MGYKVRWLNYHNRKKTEDGTKAVPFVDEAEVPDIKYNDRVFYFLDTDRKAVLMIPLCNLISCEEIKNVN